MYVKYLFLLGSTLVISTPAMAREVTEISTADSVRDDLITVTATGSETRVDQGGQAVSVIGADEIEAVQGADITRVFDRLPGVTLVRNGGLGGSTSLFVRGADAQQLLVMADGIRIADASLNAGGYDFGNLMNGGIGKIELLRGSNSVVWGSDAIGGVLALTSRDFNGIEASAEYGSRDTFDAQVNAGINGDGYAVNVNGGYTRTDGISQYAGGTEPDGFRQWRMGGRARVDLTPRLSARVAGRFSTVKLDIDGYPAPNYVFADDSEYQKTRQAAGLAGLSWTGDKLSLDASYQISDTRRRYFDPTASADGPTSTYDGRTQRAQILGTYRVTGAVRLDFGADREWSHIGVKTIDRFLYGADQDHKANLSSGHALLGYYTDAVTVAAGVRYDDHSRFGHAWTFGANGSVGIVGQLRARASYGEGFKAPSLYQLFSEYGNSGLLPERSRSYDAGLEWGDRNGVFFAAVTAFRRDSRNLIDFAYCPASNALCDDGRFGYYENVGKARSTGVELELAAQVSPRVHAQAVYTYVRTENRTRGAFNEGNDLARRPRNALTLSLDWTSPVGLVLGGDIRMVSDSFNDAGNSTPIDGWATGTIRASLPLDDRFELFGRVENVTDAHYTVVSDYGTYGRSVYAGVRVKM